MLQRAAVALVLIGAACTNAESEEEGDLELQVDESELCPGPSLAHQTLSTFWQAFDLNYATFDLRLPGDGWKKAGLKACAKVNDGPVTDSELFDLLIGMARHLDDGHVDLIAQDIGREEDADVTPYPHEDALEILEDNVEENYLEEDAFNRDAQDEIAWGHIRKFGYISITSMEELAPSTDPDDSTADERAAHRAMAKVMADLGDAPGIIVDVRANGGGWDTVSLAIAAWFAGPRALAWSEQRRNGPAHDDFGPWEDTHVEKGTLGAYAGPVVLLTSGGTFSAAEVFSLVMRVRDRVTILGEPTSGHFSDLFEGELPNGWGFHLSDERYRAADGMIYETRGAPVDRAIALDPAQLELGRDVMLEAALESLQ